MIDAGDAGPDEVYAQPLRPYIKFFVSFPAGPDVDVVDCDIRLRVLLLNQLRILERGHAADARAVNVAHGCIPRAYALQESYGLGDLARARAYDLTLRRPGGIQHPLHLQCGDHIPIPSKAVLLFSGGIEGLPARGHDYRSHIYLKILRLLFELDGLCGTRLHAAGAADAGLGIDTRRQGNCLGVGHIDGLPLADAKVVFAGHFHWTDARAFVDAAFAEQRVHIARTANA